MFGFSAEQEERVLVESEDSCPFRQEDMSTCLTRGHVFLFDTNTCLLVKQEEVASCSTGRHDFLFNEKKALDISSC